MGCQVVVTATAHRSGSGWLASSGVKPPYACCFSGCPAVNGMLPPSRTPVDADHPEDLHLVLSPCHLAGAYARSCTHTGLHRGMPPSVGGGTCLARRKCRWHTGTTGTGNDG